MSEHSVDIDAGPTVEVRVVIHNRDGSTDTFDGCLTSVSAARDRIQEFLTDAETRDTPPGGTDA